MANEDVLRLISGAEAALLSAGHYLRDAKEALGAEPVVPPPGSTTPPEPTHSLVTVGRKWSLQGVVNDWNDALVFPAMGNLAGFSQADLKFKFEVGPEFGGLRNLIYLTENAGKWKGDVVLLVNRGDNGKLAVSNTLGGKETVPVRDDFPLEAGQVLECRAWLQAGRWTVTCGAATCQMPSTTLTSTKLNLQLGNSSKDGVDHPPNSGWKLLSLEGSVA